MITRCSDLENIGLFFEETVGILCSLARLWGNTSLDWQEDKLEVGNWSPQKNWLWEGDISLNYVGGYKDWRLKTSMVFVCGKTDSICKCLNVDYIWKRSQNLYSPVG